MALPTLTADPNARTNAPLPYARDSAFGTGVSEAQSQLGESMEGAGVTIARSAQRVRAKQETAKRFDENRWAGDKYEEEKRTISEFMANPNNSKSETFSKDLDTFIRGRLQSYTGETSPSPRALAIFKSNISSWANTQYIHSLGIENQNKIAGGVESINNQVSAAIDTYHNMRSVNGDQDVSSLVDSIAHINANIEANFRKLDPGTADKMHQDLITQSVYATMDTNPKAAHAILDSSSKIDAITRHQLEHQIQQSQNSQGLVLREGFNNYRQDALVRAEQGSGGNKIDIDSYRLYYPDDQAVIQKSRDDAYIDSMNQANKAIQEISPWSAPNQLKYLSDMQKDIVTDEQKMAYQRVSNEISAQMRLQDKDPVAWLKSYNPTIKALASKAQYAGANNQVGALTNLNSAVLKFQGAPPSDATDEERKQYLDKPIAEQHLMGTGEATQMAGDLNASNPKEFIKKMGEALMRYPDEFHQHVAFNDMVTLPSAANALRQEYQVAWQNKGAWWLDTYLGALHAGKDIKIPENDVKEITKHVDANPMWLQFQATITGDNFGRSDQVRGFRDGIQQYAQALASQGRGVKDAANSAVKMIISETLGFAKVNGKPLAIARDQGTGVPLSDAETADMGRRLGVALSFVDPKYVDQKPFTALRSFGNDEMHQPRIQALSDSIRARGFFQTGPDGKSASLYYMDDNGIPFQVRDRKNQPFNIMFADLPKFMKPTVQEWMSQFPTVAQANAGIKPKPMNPSVPIQPKENWGVNHQVTNFPTWGGWKQFE